MWAKWVAIEFDETGYWNEDFLEKYGIEKVRAVYVYNENLYVHCCEITPSYELWFINDYPVMKSEADTGREEAWEAVMEASTEPVEYHHVQHLDRIPFGEHKKRMWSENIKRDEYDEHRDDAIESERCNGSFC